VTLATPPRPGQSTLNNQGDLSAFLRRIVADACSRMALVNTDLRRPRVAEHTGLRPEVGLSAVPIRAADVQDAIGPRGQRAA
jgi:hypothetical protein